MKVAETFPLESISRQYKLHIQKALLQSHKGINANTIANTAHVLLAIGYEESENGGTIPIVISEQVFPEDFPHLFTCLK